MLRKALSALLFFLLLAGIATLSFRAQPVNAIGTIYIRADGSIDPPTAPVQRNGNVYFLTDNIAISGDCIVIQRNNIVLDGADFLIQGNLSGRGVSSTATRNVTIKNMNIQRFEYDIYFESTSSDTVFGNNLTKDCFYGISFYSSSGNTISGNNVTNSRYWGIGLFSSSNNTVTGNNESGNGYGVQLTESFDNIVSGNDVTDSYYGIEIGDAYNNTICDNNSTNSLRGIFLESDFSGNSSGNILRRNAFAGNTFNFGVHDIPDFFNDVDMSNTVDGKPICYWINVHDVSVPLDAGYVALINSTRVAVSDLNLASNEQGVLLAYATYITITQNNVTNNRNGISLYSSSCNTIAGNTVTRNGVYWGIGLFSSSNNTVTGNNVTDNDYDGVVLESSSNNIVAENSIAANSGGINLGSSSGNTVTGNDMKNNGLYLSSSSDNTFAGNNVTGSDGIWLLNDVLNNTFIWNRIANNYVGVTLYSSNNRFYHNEFIDNSFQVNVSYPGVDNFWDDGYPTGGNYWSNYNGADLYSGPYQNQTGSDGIGDTPYIIDPNNIDNYPLMNPWILPEHDIAIINVSPFKTVVGLGYSMNLSVIAMNQGEHAEAFNVTVYANMSVIGTQTVNNLLSGASIALVFTWNTTGVVFGNYTLSSYAEPVLNETDTSNNNCTCDFPVHIGVPGDVSSSTLGVYDGVTNMKDVAYLVLLFNTRPSSSNWNPNADINNDGVCNMRDIATAIFYFNQHE